MHEAHEYDTSMRRDVLQCVAVCCSVLQRVAVCVSCDTSVRRDVLQCVAVCCSVLQCASHVIHL